jgi:hypothetical protein
MNETNGSPSYAHPMAPPSVPLRLHASSSRPPSSSRGPPVAFPLPPHPHPNPIPTLGARRPRTPSLDYAAQPPSKRSRAAIDDQRGREPRPSYSESVRPAPSIRPIRF